MIQNISRSIHCTLACVMIAGLAGCQSMRHRLYEGAELPRREVAYLELPHITQLISVDGAPLKRATRMGAAKTSSYSLLPGRHKLTVRYHEIWPVGEDDHETLSSDPVPLEFDFEAGAVYRLHTQGPATLESAQSFKNAPQFSFSREASLPSEHEPSRPVLKTMPRIKHASASATVTVSRPGAAADDATLNDLKSSWQKATPSERSTFRKWIVDH